MDIFKSPWKSSIIQDPILSLSNSQSKKCERKESISDRYCFDGLCKKLFHLQNDDTSEGVDSNIKMNGSQEKDKKYRGLLVRTCSFESDKKPIKNTPAASVLNYSSKIKRPGYMLGIELQQQQQHSSKPRNIPKQPYRILNAPKLKDDFYTSLLDWSSQDIVSVVLQNAAYIWSSKQNETQKLVQGFISSIKWGKGLVIGQQTGKIRVIDTDKKKQTLKYRSHNARIGTIDCSGSLIVSGSKDCNVMIWDVRSKQMVNKWDAHKQQVCGVKWSFDSNYIASGGNDNIVTVWDCRAGKILCKFNEHIAAVKALAWSPQQNYILSTGGGSTDKTIRMWNINDQKCIKKVDTGSQVCNMMYSINSNELVSTHGFSMNAINIWNGKNMQKVGTMRGHSYRVLYLAGSPDGQSILTGSGDQTLRFWKVFPSSPGIYNRVSNLQAKNTYLR